MILTRDGKEIVAIYKQDGDEVDEVKDANGRLVYTNTREITGTLPLSFTSRGKPLADYRISGNTIQDGTPSPEAPVDVVGCGARTGNLLDYTTVENTQFNTVTLITNGISVSGKYFVRFRIVNFIIGQRYSMAWTTKAISGTVVPRWRFEYTDNTYSSFSLNGSRLVVEKKVQSLVLYVNSSDTETGVAEFTDIMLNTGSTALPYEPYGYKLPITVNGTEYPIYLGEVQTTRQIKKYEFTGQEDFFTNEQLLYNNTLYFGIITNFGIFGDNRGSLNSHFYTAPRGNSPQQLRYECSGFNPVKAYSNYYYMRINLDTIGSPSAGAATTAFKTWLATQYAAGTPVTVWYVLANPETSVVNEPLMKIGNYADTITMAQAGVTIPTTSGTNVLDMSSPVKPSDVYIKGKGIRAIT